MKTFLPFSHQHRENSCVSGIGKYNYYSEISFCNSKNLDRRKKNLNMTDKYQLLFLYLESYLKLVQGLTKGQKIWNGIKKWN